MKKLVFLIIIPVAFVMLASPLKSKAQDFIYTDKYYVCEKIYVPNQLTSARHPVVHKCVIDPDINVNETRYMPNPLCLDKYIPLPNRPKKKPVRSEM